MLPGVARKRPNNSPLSARPPGAADATARGAAGGGAGPFAIEARLAAEADGVVSRSALLAAGLTRSDIAYRLRTGRLHRLHAGVYAVGHASLTERGWLRAALLAGGPSAVLSHRTAADRHEIRFTSSRRVEVTVAANRTGGDRFAFHRSQLNPDEVTEVDGLPVTSVARTLLDLAEVLAFDGLVKAMREAEYRRLLDVHELEAVLARGNGRHGCGPLRRALAAGYADLRSPAEAELCAFLDARGLPRPQFNVLVLGHLVDAWWPEASLVVELDGFAAHTTRHRFRRDRRQDVDLRLAGIEVVRITLHDLRHDGDWLEETLRTLISRGRRARPAR